MYRSSSWNFKKGGGGGGGGQQNIKKWGGGGGGGGNHFIRIYLHIYTICKMSNIFTITFDHCM